MFHDSHDRTGIVTHDATITGGVIGERTDNCGAGFAVTMMRDNVGEGLRIEQWNIAADDHDIAIKITHPSSTSSFWVNKVTYDRPTCHTAVCVVITH